MIETCVFFLLLLSSSDTVVEPIAGRVETTAGAPLSGARIDLLASDGTSLTAVAADEAGRFELAPAGAKRLRVTAEGFLAREVEVSGGPLVVRLVPAATIQVHVSSYHENEAVADATVRIFSAAGVPDEDLDRGSLREGSTDEAGVARFEGLAPGAYWIRVEAEGFQSPLASRVELTQGVERKTVRILPALTVTGRVLDGEGSPLTDAEVGFIDAQGDRGEGEPHMGWIVDDWQEVDEQGRFHIVLQEKRMWFGKDVIVARAPGRAPAFAHLQRREGKSSFRVDLVPGPPAWIEGRVLDEEEVPVAALALLVAFRPAVARPGSEDRIPLERVDLAMLLGLEDSADFTTDAQGRFRIGPMTAGEVSILPYREGHVKELALSHQEIARGEVIADLTFHWTRGRELEGKVVDESGEPLAGASLEVLTSGHGAPRVSASAHSEATGTFTLGGLEGEAVERLRMRASGYGTRVLTDVPLDGEKKQIRLRPAGSLSGRVFDASTGAPVEAFSIELEPERRGENLLGEKKTEVFSDPEGVFLVERITPGTYSVGIQSPRHLPEKREEVEVRVGEEIPLVPVHLEPGGRIRGRVLELGTTEPVPGAEVRFSPGMRASRSPFRIRSDETDEEGSFLLEGIAGDEIHVWISHPEYAGVKRTVAFQEGSSEAELTVHLGRGGTIVATVLGSGGEPVPGAMVIVDCKDPDGGQTPGGRAWTDGTGTATIRNLLPGTCTVKKERGPLQKEVAIVEGETARVVLEPEGTQLHGTVTWGGAPFEGADIYVVPKTDRPWGRPPWRIDAHVEGPFYETEPLPAGQVQLTAIGRIRDPDLPEQEKSLIFKEEITVPEKTERLRFDIDFPRLRVSGRLVRADTGEGLAGGGVGMWEIDGNARNRTTTEGGGVFEIHPPRPGRYRVTASHPDLPEHRLEEKTIEVPEAGEVTGLELRLVSGETVSGRVVDAAGRPISQAMVRFHVARGPRTHLPFSPPWFYHLQADPVRQSTGSSVVTDSEGAFRLTGLSENDGLLWASHRDYAPAWIPLNPGEYEGSREIVLDRGGTLRIRPPEDWRQASDRGLRLTNPALALPLRIIEDGRRFAGGYLESLSNGMLVVSHLPAGTWTVELTGGGASHRAVVEVEEGGEVRVEL